MPPHLHSSTSGWCLFVRRYVLNALYLAFRTVTNLTIAAISKIFKTEFLKNKHFLALERRIKEFKRKLWCSAVSFPKRLVEAFFCPFHKLLTIFDDSQPKRKMD